MVGLSTEESKRATQLGKYVSDVTDRHSWAEVSLSIMLLWTIMIQVKPDWFKTGHERIFWCKGSIWNQRKHWYRCKMCCDMDARKLYEIIFSQNITIVLFSFVIFIFSSVSEILVTMEKLNSNSIQTRPPLS